MSRERRIVALEAAIGAPLPADYRVFLLDHTEAPGATLQVVSTNPEYWDVRSLYEIGEGADHLQADRCYALVGDVIPKGMWPVAEDGGGNLYLYDGRPGLSFGAIYWWDHEQEVGEDRISKVANTFQAFREALVPEDDA